MTRSGWPDLPQLLAEIADVVGIDAALAIAEAKGGQAVSIPSRMADDHWLVRAIGRDKALALSHHFGSGVRRVQLEVPLGPSGSYLADRRRRARLVREALAEGTTANEAARRAGITRRSVHRQKARGSDGGQGTLL